MVVVLDTIHAPQEPQSVACSTASQAWNLAESSVVPVPLPALVTHSAWATAAAATRAVAASSRRTLVFIADLPRDCSDRPGRLPEIGDLAHCPAVPIH